MKWKRYIKRIKKKKKKDKKLRILKSLAHFEVWSSSQSELMPFFCFIVYNGHTLCLSNVISPINVSGKFTLENASLYEDLTYCTCTCFVLFHIKCVDMSIILLRGMLNNTGITEKALLRDYSCIPQTAGKGFLDRLSKWTARDCLLLKQMQCYSQAFSLLFCVIQLRLISLAQRELHQGCRDLS